MQNESIAFWDESMGYFSMIYSGNGAKSFMLHLAFFLFPSYIPNK